MTSRSTINPSHWTTSIEDLLFHFRLNSPEARAALLAREGVWSSENEALRSELNRCREKELRMRTSLKDEIATRNESERWFKQSSRVLEEKLEDERRQRKELEVERVGMDRIIDALEKQTADFEYRVSRLKSEKIAMVSELLRRNEVLEEEKREVEVGVKKKIDKLERILNLIRRLKKEKVEKIAEVERIFNEKIRMEAELKKDIRTLDERIWVLEIDNGGKRTEIERIMKEYKALEEKKRKAEESVKEEKSKLAERIGVLEKEKGRLEEEVKKKKKFPQLAHSIQVLKKEKVDLEAELGKTKSEKSTEIERITKEYMALEETKRKAEECVKEENSKLVDKIEVLEKEKGRLEEEVNGKIPQLAHSIQVLKKEKCEMEAELQKTKSESSAEIERILNEKIMKEYMALEEKKSKTEECVKEENSILVDRIDVLEKEKVRLEEEVKKKICQLTHSIQVLKKEKVDLEAELQKTKSEKRAEIEKILNEKVALEDLKNRMEAELKGENRELVERIRVLEIENGAKRTEIERIMKEYKALEEEKRKAEECVKEENSVDRIEVLERDKLALEAEVSKIEMDRNNVTLRMQNVKKTLEAEKKILEKEKNEKISELKKRAVVLKREKAQMEAEIQREKKYKNGESDRIVQENKALETQKRLTEEADKQASAFLETIMVLEREREPLDTELLKLYKEKRKYIQRIGVLEREKKEMEAKVCQADKEKSEATPKILNGNIAMEAEKDDYEKRILELADRISILVREKQGLEAEIMQKDEAIKVLDQENIWLEGVKKEQEKEINRLASKLKEDVQLFPSVHHTDDVGTLSTPCQSEGQSSAGVTYSSEHCGSVSHNVENSDDKSEDGMTRSNACKRKRPIRKCEEVRKKILKATCEHLSTSLRLLVPCKWEVDQDLLDAFDVSPELCLKAVCALYRQHMRLPDSTNTSLSDKAKTLAKYLIDEVSVDSRMKKLVGKLEKLDDLAVGVCRNIAKAHYKQVFEIYKKKEDPLFFN